MSEKDTGGQAYPISFIESFTGDEVTIQGMTLRDYFAGQALIALVSKSPFIDRDGEFSEKQSQDYLLKYIADICESAYCYAYAMLKERDK